VLFKRGARGNKLVVMAGGVVSRREAAWIIEVVRDGVRWRTAA